MEGRGEVHRDTTLSWASGTYLPAGGFAPEPSASRRAEKHDGEEEAEDADAVAVKTRSNGNSTE